jgi:HAMP domain-containing protein
MPGGYTFDQLFQIGQTLFLILLAFGGGAAAWLQNRKKANEGKPSKTVKLPGDALTKPHPDPIVVGLQAEVKRLGVRSQEQQDELTSMSGELRETRREVTRLDTLLRKADDRFYGLRRVIRRLMDAWPRGYEMPHLTPEEFDLIGVDENTLPADEVRKAREAAREDYL